MNSVLQMWSPETRETSLYRVLQSKAYFDILNRQGVAHECDRRTDRQTDFGITNATLHSVARQKMWTADGGGGARARALYDGYVHEDCGRGERWNSAGVTKTESDINDDDIDTC